MIFQPIKYFPTNWEDGMKLGSSDFQHLENSIEDSIRDSNALAINAAGSFGILPYSRLSLRNSEGTRPGFVRVILESCQAIMPGGYRVEILPNNITQKQIPERPPVAEFKYVPGVRYHIFLVVNDQKRIGAGIPSTTPIRLPYLFYDYVLQAIPQEKIAAAKKIAPNRMKIAEWQDGKRIEKYIPPTLNIKGFALLDDWHKFFQIQLENIVRIGTQVIHQYRGKDPVRADFCEPVIHFIRSSKGYFKWTLPNQAPYCLVAYYGDLAGLVEGLMETLNRDFVRHQLKEGQIHNLRFNINRLFKDPQISLEDIAINIIYMKDFGDSLFNTFKSLISSQPPRPKSGERNIASG